MLRPHPTSTLFPYTTLFRSLEAPRKDINIPKIECITAGNALHGETDTKLHEEPYVAVVFHVTLLTKHPCMTPRSEEYTSELQSRFDLVCRLLLEKKKKKLTQ